MLSRSPGRAASSQNAPVERDIVVGHSFDRKTGARVRGHRGAIEPCDSRHGRRRPCLVLYEKSGAALFDDFRH